jgi:hypothetical protein
LPFGAVGCKLTICILIVRKEFKDEKVVYQDRALLPGDVGSFSVTISLKPGNEYRFRYLVDSERWENDWEADKYLPNEFGTEDSVVVV